MFRDVHLVTEDYSIRIQLGMAIFRWWRPITTKTISEGICANFALHKGGFIMQGVIYVSLFNVCINICIPFYAPLCVQKYFTLVSFIVTSYV